MTDDVEVVMTRLRLDPRTLQSSTRVSLHNIGSNTLSAPIRAFVENISRGDVTVANADDEENGIPYFEYPEEILPPGASTSIKTWYFNNPNRAAFKFDIRVEAVVLSGNTPPVANAGPDQTKYTGQLVTLNGSASSDADGDSLTFSWSFVSKPVGSGAALNGVNTFSPSFVIDIPGNYEIELVVNDGSVHSAPDTVLVSTLNSPPVANAGPDQGRYFGDLVTLNGSASSDVDGDPLTYAWSFTSKPAGSAAVLSNSTAISPTFTIDVSGDYEIQLIVNDGHIDSAPDTVKISTLNFKPAANAGPDQSRYTGNVVTLDGSGSSDLDGDSLTYLWSITSKPDGSTAALNDPTALKPSFTIDVFGDYVIQLIVNDGELNSDPDTVTVSTLNSAPIANAGTDQSRHNGEVVTLNGSVSSDVDGDLLSFVWSILSKPAGSNASLDDPAAVNPTFTIDVTGDYVVQLIVNDGDLDSSPDTVTVTTLNSAPIANAGPDRAASTGDMIILSGSLSSDVDGNPLSYSWIFTSRPADSTAVLTNPTSVNPSFAVDKSGTYVVQLIVNDGSLDSAADTVSITTENSAPVANAGPDQAAPVGQTVTLDGSGSLDADGNPITYSWSFSSLPADSAATLSVPTDVNPSFDLDKPGSYVVQLIVSDGSLDSAPDSVTITTTNSTPVAEAGPGQTALVGQTVTLDGSGSSDVDGNTLIYKWSFSSKPGGSSATLDDAAAVHPKFSIDKPGTYVVQLIVNDGAVDSAPDSVTITTENSPPVANAGPNQTENVGQTVTLDGSGSSDVDGDPLTYTWVFTSFPDGSTASLSNPSIVNPTFVIDKSGTYVLSLVVNDGHVNSAPDSVSITTENTPPVANAGSDQTSQVTDLVQLDGSGSTDVDGNVLTYAWSFVTRPSGSTATLSGATLVNPTFTLDKFGTYVVQLIVNDGIASSAPDTVSITTENTAPVANAGLDQTIHAGDPVALDGSGSQDVDGNLLTYTWSLTPPAGSGATLSNTNDQKPTFTTDVLGVYVAQLIVNDGTVNSAPDTVSISTTNSAPVANAGSNQNVTAGTTISLNGGASFDADSDPLTFNWSLISLPAGSTAVLSDATISNPTFDADLAGTYVAQLIVNDDFVNSAPNTTTITAAPVPPTSVTLTPSPAQVPTQSTLVMTVTLDHPAQTGGQVIDLAATNALVTVPASVTVPQGALSTTFDVVSGLTTGDVEVSAMATGLTGDAATVTVIPRDFSLSSPLVGINRTVTASIHLTSPAPAGGAVFNLSVNDTGVATVSPASVTIPAGQSSGNFQITGGTGVGFATITANGTGSGYGVKTLDITVTDRLIDLPGAQELFLGEIVSIPVLIAPDAAPAGGVVLAVESSNPSVVSVLTPSVTVPEGGFQATVQIQAATNAAGSAVITASNAGFAPDTMSVAVTTALNIVQTYSEFDQNQTDTLYVELISGGAPYPAPAGGVQVALTSQNGDCVAVTSPITIAEGQTYGTATLSYGGVSTSPCTCNVTATSTLFGSDVIPVTINDAPDIGTISFQDIHHGDWRIGTSVKKPMRMNLSTGNHGGVKAQIKTNDPALLLVSPSLGSRGTPIIEVTVPNGQTYADFYIEGVEASVPGGTVDTAQISVTIPVFTPTAATITVTPLVFHIYDLTTPTTSLSADDPFYVQCGYINSGGNFHYAYGRATGGPLQVTVTSSDALVGVLKTSGGSGA
ncbi:MAG: PKD domain-containing protein, partial [Pseudomonadota bacterium]